MCEEDGQVHSRGPVLDIRKGEALVRWDRDRPPTWIDLSLIELED